MIIKLCYLANCAGSLNLKQQSLQTKIYYYGNINLLFNFAQPVTKIFVSKGNLCKFQQIWSLVLQTTCKNLQNSEFKFQCELYCNKDRNYTLYRETCKHKKVLNSLALAFYSGFFIAVKYVYYRLSIRQLTVWFQ